MSFINHHIEKLIEDPEQVFTDLSKWQKEYIDYYASLENRFAKFDLIEYSEQTEPLREQVNLVSKMFRQIDIAYMETLDGISTAEDADQVTSYLYDLDDDINTLVDETLPQATELKNYVSLYCPA